jgi:hypothetical protein
VREARHVEVKMKEESSGQTLSRGVAGLILAALLLVATWNYLDRAAAAALVAAWDSRADEITRDPQVRLTVE